VDRQPRRRGPRRPLTPSATRRRHRRSYHPSIRIWVRPRRHLLGLEWEVAVRVRVADDLVVVARSSRTVPGGGRSARVE
jgi:hypothetical protein